MILECCWWLSFLNRMKLSLSTYKCSARNNTAWTEIVFKYRHIFFFPPKLSASLRELKYEAHNDLLIS